MHVPYAPAATATASCGSCRLCDKQRICLSTVKLLTEGAKQREETAAHAAIFQLARESNKMRIICSSAEIKKQRKLQS